VSNTVGEGSLTVMTDRLPRGRGVVRVVREFWRTEAPEV